MVANWSRFTEILIVINADIFYLVSNGRFEGFPQMLFLSEKRDDSKGFDFYTSACVTSNSPTLFIFSSRSARQSPTSHQPFIGELQHQNSDLQRELGNLKKELELTNQKLGSSMHSIKTFWSPELKKERALRKEESAKYSLINDQLKLLSSENQVRNGIVHPYSSKRTPSNCSCSTM